MQLPRRRSVRPSGITTRLGPCNNDKQTRTGECPSNLFRHYCGTDGWLFPREGPYVKAVGLRGITDHTREPAPLIHKSAFDGAASSPYISIARGSDRRRGCPTVPPSFIYLFLFLSPNTFTSPPSSNIYLLGRRCRFHAASYGKTIK